MLRGAGSSWCAKGPGTAVKYEYAGITVDLGYWVEILDVNAASPVFHRQYGFKQEEGRWWTSTACGRTLYEETTDLVTGKSWTTDHSHASLPSRHAVKFARPCSTCWPQLRGQRSLFTKPKPTLRGEQTVIA